MRSITTDNKKVIDRIEDHYISRILCDFELAFGLNSGHKPKHRKPFKKGGNYHVRFNSMVYRVNGYYDICDGLVTLFTIDPEPVSQYRPLV